MKHPTYRALIIATGACLFAPTAPAEPTASYPGAAPDWQRLSDLATQSPTMRKIAERGRLLIGTSFRYRSLNSKNADGACEGFIADYGKALAARLLGDPGKVEWVSTGDGALESVMRGEVDVLIDPIPKGRPGDPTGKVDFVGEFLRGGEALLVRKSGTIRSIGDIRNSTRILYPKSAEKQIQWLKSNAPGATYIEFPDADAAFEALKGGRGDFVTADVPTIYDLASRDPAYSGTSRYTDCPYSMIIKRGDPAWHRYLNEFNEDLLASGGYEALYQKWLFPLSGEMLR